MNANPVLKPKVATPALIMSSAAVSFCLIYFVGALAANGQTPWILTLAAAAPVLLAVIVGAIWLARARGLHAWTTAANEMWNHLDAVRRTRGTTTEVTLLGVDALEPTGSWITIRWNRFAKVVR